MKSILQNRITVLTAAMCCLIYLLAGCSRDNDIVIPQTSIYPINATSATIGDEITLTGENMHLISQVNFGETIIPIETLPVNRDHNSLSIIVPATFEATQKVMFSATYNSVHRITICDEFEIIVPPVIPSVSTTLAGEIKPGDIVEITGNNLLVIKSILANNEVVDIRSKNATTITFKAPEVDADTEFTITLIYDNSLGNDQQLVVPGKVTVKEIVPAGNITSESQEVETGKNITIEGTDLNIVKAVRLTTGGTSSDITVTNPGATSFSFKAPEVDADTEFTVTLIYGKSDKESASVGTVKVKKATVVLTYNYWENVTLGAPGTECALFDASTGKTITPCDVFDHQSDVDFAMDATSSVAARLLNPASINDAFMKAQICGETALFSDGKDYTTLRAALKTQFKLLSTGSATENALIQKVMNGEITDIKEDIGTINPSTNTPTVVENSVLVFKNSIKDKMGLIWIKSVTLGDKKELNTVSMDVYYEK